jgi:hypothetical protein
MFQSKLAEEAVDAKRSILVGTVELGMYTV